MDTKVVERKPLTWAEKTYIPQIVGGLITTLKNLFRPNVTLQYPEERPVIPSKYRGIPTLVKDPNDRIKCVACQLCEFVCPPRAITIKPQELESDDPHAHVEKRPKTFEIDMLRCIYCGFCEEACPEEAIFLQKTYSLSGLSRKEMVFDKEKLLELGGTYPDQHFKWDKKLKAEQSNTGAH